MKKLTALALTVLMFTLQPAEAAENFRIGTGLNYSSSSSSSTNIWSMQLTGSYEKGPLLFRLTVPYLLTSGTGNKSSDLGDVVGGVTCNVLEGKNSAPRIDLTGKVKFGTASTKNNFGSGRNDYSLQADLAELVGRKFTALGTAGYRWNSDTATTNFKNVIFGSVGGSYKFTPKASGGLLYNIREASRTGFSAEQTLAAFVGYKFPKSRRLQIYAAAGLNSSSPAVALGTSISTGF